MYFIVQKVQEVVERTALVKQAYDSLTEAANADIIKKWSAEEKDAQARRAKDVLSMDLFDIHLKQGWHFKSPI